MAGYYSSLRSENVRRLVLYAPLHTFNDLTNLGPGSGLQNKRKPQEFNLALGAYRLASETANTGRWNGEIPVDNKDEYRDPALPVEFWNACLATDPTSNSRTPASLRAPNGVLEDSFNQATGRPLWNAANIYAPTLVIAGNYDTWSYPEGSRRIDTRSRSRVGEAKHAHSRCDALRAVREDPVPVLRNDPEVSERIDGTRSRS